MTITKRTAAVALTCATVGAGAGIAGSMAAPGKSDNRAAGSARDARDAGDAGKHRGGPVRAEVVVLNEAGDKWITVTEESGTVQKVDGRTVTIARGTAAVPYQDAVVELSDDATVVRNGAKAQVADLKQGDRISVRRSSEGTSVFAAAESWRPRGGRAGHPAEPGKAAGHGPRR